ncbi:hypothetical protein LCGC14_1745160, partial [marine sediment metagenome]
MPTIVETQDVIEPLAPEWDDLADRVGAEPFLRPGWIGAWWRAFGRGRLEVVSLRRDGRLAGVLPTYRRRGVTASTTNWHTPLFEPLVEDPDATEELMRALFSLRARRLSLGWLSSNGSALSACRETALAAGYRSLEREVARSPFISIDGDWR